MPITSSSVFDAVVLLCNCESGNFGAHYVQQGRTGPNQQGNIGEIPLPQILSPTNPEVAEVIARVRAGSVKAYYLDGGTSVWAAVESAPFEFWQFHGRHPFWPRDGYQMLDRIATKGNIEESTNGRYFQFDGGFEPLPTPVASSTFDQSLEDWRANRNGSVVGFRISVPLAEQINSANLATWPKAKAMRDWLESIRVAGTGDVLGDSLNSSWPSGVEFDMVLSDTNTVRLTTPRTSPNFTAQGYFTSIWLIFDATSGTPDLDEINALLQRTTVGIPGAGMMVENPWGNTAVRGSVRDLAMEGGRIEMPNGLPIANFRDPREGAIERSIPLVAGYGRTVTLQNLPSHTGTSRRIPYPEEIPFLNNIHMAPLADQDLHFNDIARIVGFSGADRRIELSNTGTPATNSNHDLTLKDWRDNDVLVLRPGEACSAIASLTDYGEAELRIIDAPFRRQIHDATAAAFVTTRYYHYQPGGGTAYWLRPFVAANAPVPLYNDADAFGAGTGELTNETSFSATNYVSTPEAVILKHSGDLVIYAEIECEVTASGTLPAGHSAIIVRKRGNSVQFFNVDSQPALTGINTSRTYSVFFWAEAEEGDEYQVMLLYPTASTLNVGAALRVVDYRRIIRLTPRIEIT